MLFQTPETNADNPPQSWLVVKLDPGRWQLTDKNGGVIDTFPRKRDAEAARVGGFAFDLWNKERRWFAGEPVSGWKPYPGKVVTE